MTELFEPKIFDSLYS